MKKIMVLSVLILISHFMLINSFSEKIENNSEITILSKKENRYFFFEVPGEGSTTISVHGKSDSDKSILYINESCSKKCVSGDVEEPTRESNCYSDNGRLNIARQTSTEKCLIYIGVNPTDISMGILIRINFEPIIETSKGYDNWIDLEYNYNNIYKYFSYTFSPDRMGVLNIYANGIHNDDKYSISYSSNCSFCSLKNILFPTRETSCDKTDVNNYSVLRLNVFKEECKVYFSVYSYNLVKGVQLKLRFDEITSMKSSNEFILVESDRQAYKFFNFQKEKSFGEGLVWIIAKTLNSQNKLQVYSANNSPNCKITDEFITYSKNCFSLSNSDNYQSFNYYYSDSDSEDKIRFSIWPNDNSGYHLKTLFIPMTKLKINDDFIKFVIQEKRSYSFFQIPVGQEFVGSQLTINVIGESQNEQNIIYMTTSKSEPNCVLNEVKFPDSSKFCFNSCNRSQCYYETNNSKIIYAVSQPTVLYIAVSVKEDNGGSMIRVTSNKNLQFLS